QGTSAFTATGVLSAGQLLIGTGTSSAPIPANLTAGSGITITTASGAITVSASGGELTFDEDGGSATPSGGILNLLGTAAQGISTTGGGNTVVFTIADATSTQKGVSYLADTAAVLLGAATMSVVTPADLTTK